jgi:hypothetical protein
MTLPNGTQTQQPAQQPQGQAPQQQPGQQPPQGQQPQQPQQGFLNQDALLPQQQDPNGQQPQGTPPGQQVPQNAPDVQAIITQAMQQMTSEIDRRINGVVGTLRREFAPAGQPQQQYPGQQPYQQPYQGQPQGQPPAPQQGQPQPVFTGPSNADLSEARGTYRDFIGDQVTQFLGPQEREFAQDLANALITERLGTGGRADEVGKDVAKAVGDRVKQLRDMYESKTTEALRRRGMLKDDGQGGMPLPGGQQQAGATNGYAAAQQRARDMHKNRLPQPQTK